MNSADNCEVDVLYTQWAKKT